MLDFDGRIRWIDTLGIIPSRCIERVDDVHGDRTLFHGCYDWHSSVHGHWALFRMDLTGSGRYHDVVNQVSKRFTEEKISAVIDELEQATQFEMPYGRAWLLRLVIEYEKWVQVNHAPLPGNWRRLGDHAAESLRAYYLGEGHRRIPDILSNQYSNDSFSIVQLFDYFRHRMDGRSLLPSKTTLPNTSWTATSTSTQRRTKTPVRSCRPSGAGSTS